MNKPDLNLQCLLDALRPLDYRCSVIDPDGLVIHEARFGTKAEAKKWTAANRGERDVAVIQLNDSAANN